MYAGKFNPVVKNIEPGCKLLFDPLIPMGFSSFFIPSRVMFTSNMSNPPKKTNSFNAPGFLHRKCPVGFWPIFSGQLQLASPKAWPLVSGTPGYTPHVKRWVHPKKQASKYGQKSKGFWTKISLSRKKISEIWHFFLERVALGRPRPP